MKTSITSSIIASALLLITESSYAACNSEVSGTGRLFIDKADIANLVGKTGPLAKSCTWKVSKIQADGCVVTKAKVEGAGSKPPQIDLERKSDGYSVQYRSTTGSNGNWSWTGNNLNYSTIDCGTSKYTVSTSNPMVGPGVTCPRSITLTLTLR